MSDGHGRSRWPVIAGLLLLGAATPVRADLSAQMDQLFDSLVNVTDPTAHWGQRRGVLSGGSVVARHRIVDVHPVAIVPPSYEAGCGGIDLFGC